jgi:hypothetical protein
VIGEQVMLGGLTSTVRVLPEKSEVKEGGTAATYAWPLNLQAGTACGEQWRLELGLQRARRRLLQDVTYSSLAVEEALCWGAE